MGMRREATEADLSMDNEALRPEALPGKMRRARGFKVMRLTTKRGLICVRRVGTRALAEALALPTDRIVEDK